jgi:hypothetical protein
MLYISLSDTSAETLKSEILILGRQCKDRRLGFRQHLNPVFEGLLIESRVRQKIISKNRHNANKQKEFSHQL